MSDAPGAPHDDDRIEFGRPNPARATRGAGSADRSGDVLAGPADSTRPSNPWPRLLAFGAAVVAVLALAGFCVASFAQAPDREVSVRFGEVQLGVPKFVAITSFGHDAAGNTFGAYLAVPEEGEPRAFLSREPESGCNLRWDASAPRDAGTGAFVDPCSDARYTFDGRALHDDAPRDLHEFDLRRDSVAYVVSVESLILGACRNANVEGCSQPDAPTRRDVPDDALPEGFGTR